MQLCLKISLLCQRIGTCVTKIVHSVIFFIALFLVAFDRSVTQLKTAIKVSLFNCLKFTHAFKDNDKQENNEKQTDKLPASILKKEFPAILN